MTNEENNRCPICGHAYAAWPHDKLEIRCVRCNWQIRRDELVNEDAQVAYDY